MATEPVPSEPDLLSELLAPMRLRGVFHSLWRVHGPWGIAGEGEDCALVHYVHDGGCAVEMPDQAPLWLRAGDLAVFPHGTAHRVGDRPGRATVPLTSLLPHRPTGAARVVDIDGPGPATTLLCGGLHYERATVAPLYRALPAVFVLDRATLAGEPLLRDTMRQLADGDAYAGPGRQLVTLRAFEMAFVLALRAAIHALATGVPLLRALAHPAIGAALLAIHTRPAEPWTLESLAAEAGMARSAFAARFRELVGEAPMRHLTGRRMQEAARLLTETTLAQASVARRVGYGSSTGFHLAFRRWFGTTPGDYRRGARLERALA